MKNLLEDKNLLTRIILEEVEDVDKLRK